MEATEPQVTEERKIDTGRARQAETGAQSALDQSLHHKDPWNWDVLWSVPTHGA